MIPRFARFPWPCLLMMVLIASPVAGASEGRARSPKWCGTDDTPLTAVLAKHRFHQRRADSRFAAAVTAGRLGRMTTAEVRKEGNVAVIIDNGRVIQDRNLVDLSDSGLSFKYRKKQDGYLPKSVGGGVASDLGDKLPLTDDDSIEIELPFRVEVYGTRYDSVWVNSDGNLTFGEADFASTARDIGRFLDGPPRIAPLFRDLNPETAPGMGGIYVVVGEKSLRVTWLDVPEFDSSGANDVTNTFSITLAKNGRALFKYGELLSETAIVGLSPGGSAGLELLDLTEDLPAPLQLEAVAENFSDEKSVDEPELTKALFKVFEDRYSHVVVYTDFQILLGGGRTIAQALTVQNDIRGIGLGRFDFSGLFGSSGAFQTFVMMGSLEQYPRDLEDTVFIGNAYSAADILMHEIGHRWGVRVNFEKDGVVRDDILGRASAHWSYCFDSEFSYLEGNDLVDNGDGSFSGALRRADYNDFDLYNMGLIGADGVRDSFLVEGCDGDRAPNPSASVNGTRIDISIDDIINAEGPRVPPAGDAPTKFDIAFVLLVEQGQEPQASSVAKVDQLRKLAGRRFKEAGGKLVTKLRLK